MSNGVALPMMKCALIHSCYYYNLMIELLSICVQLYDMYVDLNMPRIVGLMMYMPRNMSH